MAAHLFTTWFTEYIKPTFQTYYSEEDSFQNISTQAHGSRSNFDFQVLLFKKYIL